MSGTAVKITFWHLARSSIILNTSSPPCSTPMMPCTARPWRSCRNEWRRKCRRFLASEWRNMTWTRHSGGACLTFPNGLQWFAHADVTTPLHRPHLGMSLFVAARFSSGISACSSRHTQWGSYCNVVDFKNIKCEQATPMLGLCAPRSLRGWVGMSGKLKSDPGSVRHLHGGYSIGFDQMQRWHENHELGRSHRRQYSAHSRWHGRNRAT